MKADLRMKVTRGAESWQFFAFVFAAVVALAFALLDELPWSSTRLLSKTVA